MIDETLRGAEGLQAEWAGSGCSCPEHPSLGRTGGTPAFLLGGQAYLRHAIQANRHSPSTRAMRRARKRPGLNSHGKRGAKMGEK